MGLDSRPDAPPFDAGRPDAGRDASPPPRDSGFDGGFDAGSDGGPGDAGGPDTAMPDTGMPDTGPADAGEAEELRLTARV